MIMDAIRILPRLLFQKNMLNMDFFEILKHFEEDASLANSLFGNAILQSTIWNNICECSEISNLEITDFQMIQAVTFWSPIVGGHLTFEGVTQPSQKGHKE